MKRRKFIQQTALGAAAVTSGANLLSCTSNQKQTVMNSSNTPIAICTWAFRQANATAGQQLLAGKSALDSAIEGVAVEERNLKNTTVGKGGAPDREGHVTLDACVMAPDGNCGAVVFVEGYTAVAALARDVMLKTPHVMLAGDGAEAFAKAQGYTQEDQLTPESEAAWKEWLKTENYQPIINIENHDTIGMLCLDQDGDLAGACTTSGLSYKMRGRVGDSPIIGSGLFVDNEVGAAVGTGMGEEIMKTVGSFLIVELIRNGMSPQAACEEAVRRTVKRNPASDYQVAYIAINKQGETGGFCIHEGFNFMKFSNGDNKTVKAPFLRKKEQ
ncbi:isoaspartyl peptidase/L-asparaginase family protein [Croceiramulus getboli]|nr:N(4)-(beta-N-acetylglucosaminyl)-L-asparaginase [Flavobacteriaceae bacterium YJPT1-3]